MAIPLYLHEDIKDVKKFLELRFERAISFMHGVSNQKPYDNTSSVVEFAIFRVCGSNVHASALGTKIPSPELQAALNIVPVRRWSLIRRGTNVYFILPSVNSDDEAVVPAELLVTGGQDAERCWSRANA